MTDKKINDRDEIWKDINGFPGYQAGSYGNIRSFLNNRCGIGDAYHILIPVLYKETGYLKVNLQKKKRKRLYEKRAYYHCRDFS